MKSECFFRTSSDQAVACHHAVIVDPRQLSVSYLLSGRNRPPVRESTDSLVDDYELQRKKLLVRNGSTKGVLLAGPSAVWIALTILKENPMSNLVAVVFEDETTAFEMRTALLKMQKQYLIELEDAVVVTRNQK